MLHRCYSLRDCKHIRKGITLDVGARTTASLFKVIVLAGLFEWCMIASSVDIHGSCCRIQLNIMDFYKQLDGYTAGAALFRGVCFTLCYKTQGVKSFLRCLTEDLYFQNCKNCVFLLQDPLCLFKTDAMYMFL